MLHICENYGSIFVDVNFRNRVNILSGFSGTGKTFLFSVLGVYCFKNNLRYSKFDSSNFINVSGSEVLRGRLYEFAQTDIICLDNADLYLDSALLNELIECCSRSTIFISMHIITALETNNKDIGMYLLRFNDNMLKTGV